jgi:hypothetical protein
VGISLPLDSKRGVLMMYENAQYIAEDGVNAEIRVDINGARSFVPLDAANTDYQKIMQLVADGELVIAPAE